MNDYENDPTNNPYAWIKKAAATSRELSRSDGLEKKFTRVITLIDSLDEMPKPQYKMVCQVGRMCGKPAYQLQMLGAPIDEN